MPKLTRKAPFSLRCQDANPTAPVVTALRLYSPNRN